jgi:hypothetical protein
MGRSEHAKSMTALNRDQMDRYRSLMRELRSEAQAAFGRRVPIRKLIKSRGLELPPDLRVTVESFMERDETGPNIGQEAPDFSLKRMGSEERVLLSSFQGKRPVALIFGSYT